MAEEVGFSSLPNKITALRLVSVPFLWMLVFFGELRLFAVVYAVAAMTDIFDGWVARRFDAVSEAGSRLDSWTDLIFNLSAVAYVFILFPTFLEPFLPVISVILGVFILNILVAFAKYGKMTSNHLYSTKTAGIIGHVFVSHATFFHPNQPLFYLALGLGSIAVIENFVMTLTSEEAGTDMISVLKR